MRKKLYIFKHFAKSKKLFFCQYLSFSVWFLLKFQKSTKLKPPTDQTLPGREQFNYSRPGRVWSVTSQLGTEKSVTFFCSVHTWTVLAFPIHFRVQCKGLLCSRSPCHADTAFYTCRSPGEEGPSTSRQGKIPVGQFYSEKRI